MGGTFSFFLFSVSDVGSRYCSILRSALFFSIVNETNAAAIVLCFFSFSHFPFSKRYRQTKSCLYLPTCLRAHRSSISCFHHRHRHLIILPPLGIPLLHPFPHHSTKRRSIGYLFKPTSDIRFLLCSYPKLQSNQIWLP